MTARTHCDRCDTVAKGTDDINWVEVQVAYESYDLCPRCTKDLEAWMKGDRREKGKAKS
jgi:hypothetical protein